MEFLYLLEKIRVPVLNELMLAITELGGELPFLVIAMIVFWCVDKRRGYYVLSVGFLGTLTNQFMKLLFRIPRPWVLDPEFRSQRSSDGLQFPQRSHPERCRYLWRAGTDHEEQVGTYRVPGSGDPGTFLPDVRGCSYPG